MSDEKIIAEEEMINEETTEVSEAVEKHPVRDFFKTRPGKIVAGIGLALAALIATAVVLGREDNKDASSGDFGVPGPDDDVSDEATTIEF